MSSTSNAFETISSSSMNACMKDYWYIWTFTGVGMVLLTAIDTVIAYFFLKKFFKTDKISPKAAPYSKPSNGPAWRSSADNSSSTGSARASPAISHNSINPLTAPSAKLSHRSGMPSPRMNSGIPS